MKRITDLAHKSVELTQFEMYQIHQFQQKLHQDYYQYQNLQPFCVICIHIAVLNLLMIHKKLTPFVMLFLFYGNDLETQLTVLLFERTNTN